jgi:hypothetical protein
MGLVVGLSFGEHLLCKGRIWLLGLVLGLSSWAWFLGLVLANIFLDARDQGPVPRL